MANLFKKSKDPTEVALSAIQDALNVRDSEQKASITPPADAVAVPPASIVPQAASERWGANAAAPEEQLPLDPAGGTPAREEARAGRRAANDDRASIGQILQTLQRRPTRAPYAIAALFSLAWVICALGVVYSYAPEFEMLTSQGPAATPLLIGLVSVFLAPIGFFFVLAYMLSRSHELRIIAQSMAEVAVRLAEPEAVAHDSVVSVGQAIRREVAAMGDGVERALARASELEALVNNEVASLERTYSDNEARIRTLLEGLAQQRESFVAQAEQVRTAISNVHLDLTHDVTSVTDAVAERINDASQRMARSLAEKGDQIATAFGSASDAMISSIGTRGGDLIVRLEAASTETTSALAAATDRLTSSLNFKTDHIGDEFAEITGNIQEMMSSKLDQVIEGFSRRSEEVIDTMEARSRSLTDTLVDTSSRLAETIAVQADEVNSTLKSTGDSLILDLSLRGTDVVSKLEQASAKITDTIVKEGSELAERVNKDASSLGGLITNHLGEFDRTVNTYGAELVERLGARTQEVTESMKKHIDGFDERVTTKAVEVTASLDQRLVRFEEALDNRAQTFDDTLNSRVSEMTQTMLEGSKEVVAALEKRISDATASIATRGAALTETIGARIEDIDKTLGNRALEVANALDSRIARFEDLLVGRAETVTQEIEKRTKTAAELLGSRMEQLAETIASNAGTAERSLSALTISTAEAIRSSASEMEHSLTSLSSGVTTVLKQNATEVERTLLGVSSEVARNFVGRADEIAAAVSQRSAELTRILDDKSSGLITAIGGKSAEFTNEVSRVTEEAVRAIEAKGFTFTSTMMDNSEQLARIINDAGENATKSVNKTLQDLQETTRDAVEKSKHTAETAVAEMLETNTMLRSDTTTLFERLREANVLLQQVISGAQENMGAIEHTLSARVGEFVGAMNQIIERTGSTTNRLDNNISSFHSLASKLLVDLGDLAGHFEGHGQALSNAVELLDRSNRRADDSINERRVSLDSLLSTLDIRTEDLDQRLRRFSGLLDESLASAEGRARDVARIVAESTSESMRTISEQYDAMRATAEEERKRTTTTMRAIFDQTTGDAHDIFRDSMARFTEVVDNMKRMSTEMQRELETTRQELRRGVLELPQETAESAAQMRRVIIEQIDALDELNKIVARHGRNIDAVEPARRGAEPLLAVVGGGRGEPPRTPSVTSRDLGDTTMPTAAPSSQRRETASSRGPGPSSGRGGGWLSDLLSRASRDPEEQSRLDDRAVRGEDRPPLRGEDRPPPREERPMRGEDRGPRGDERGARADDRSPRHTIESLDSLSVDIARMIDHDAAAELWDRYNRGERNVFTRRLYTMQGQKTFDEIRKRYRSDREFKQTVDRYISEFERLLDEVSRDDRGQLVVRTYLTSETGKVYTMLAHAAGRFD
jgi:apolipoprotein A1/A4/E domain-containing protein